MENKTNIKRLSDGVSSIVHKYHGLQVEVEALRVEVVTLKSEREMKNREIERLVEENTMKDLEIEEIVNKIENILGQ